MRNKRFLTVALALPVCLLAACGGKSDLTGEIVPIERVCGFEKKKPVAVEGFIAPLTMSCEKSRKGQILGCRFTMYARADRTGAGIPVYIMASDWLSAKNNRIEEPESYAGDLVVRDRNGNPLPKKGLRIYDNDGNLIEPNGKIRIHSELPDSPVCEIRLAQRIEAVS